MSSGDVFVEKNVLPTTKEKSIYIDSHKWKTILSHFSVPESVEKVSEAELQHKEYIKRKSQEMTNKWPALCSKKQQLKNVDHKDLELEKINEGTRRYELLKKNDERIRQEQVANAMHMMQRQKIGPKELESAAILSEVLKGQEMQRKFNIEMMKTTTSNKLKEGKLYNLQSTQWIEEQQRQMAEKKKRNEAYKKEVLIQTKENERRRIEASMRQTESERKIREEADKEIQDQILREKAILDRKKEIMRRNALEAMKMVEQRRLREKMKNEIDYQIASIFEKGKQNLVDIKDDKEKTMKEKVLQQKVENVKTTVSNILKENNRENEEEILKKSVADITQQSELKANERTNRQKLLQFARIEQHLLDMKTQEIAKSNSLEERRQSIVNRLRNEEINQEYDNQKTNYKIRKAKRIQAVLLEQMKEKERLKLEEKDADRAFQTQDAERDDTDFMDYANTLIKNSKEKGRPVLPLIKAVDKYKKQHELELKIKEPRHLISNVPIANKRDAEGLSMIKYTLNELKAMNPFQVK